VASDGTLKHIHVRARRVKYASGDEMIGALMDVTAAKRAQEALQTLQAELAHVTRVTTLGEMSASIAHEVNQPLAAILSSGQAGLRWLDREVPDLEAARRALQRIVHDARRGGDVIENVRSLSKRAAPAPVELDINDLIVQVLTLLRPEAARHGVVLRLQLGADLPRVYGDRIQLQQVIINLVVNGLQAMTQVAERERVLVIGSRTSESAEVLISVEDVGAGVEPENLDRLFSPFYTTKPDGLGIGLSICRAIVEAHGGRIWASRNAGPGMTFAFTVGACGQAAGIRQRSVR
jgi:C4-dicarboxylate-specific signal transduction histidine kinase